MIEAVDLFCGAGGLTAGLRKAGVAVKAGYDIDTSCTYAYEHNNKASFVAKDVGLVSRDEVLNWYSGDKIKLLAGCAPCQPFSTYNKGKDAKKDRKWPLLYEFSRLIKEISPDLVTMENVPDVVKHKVYVDFVEDLKAAGYSIWANEVSCAEYGLPQHRRRHVLLASKFGEITLLPPTHKKKLKTVRKAIGSLRRLNAGESDAKDPLHKAPNLSVVNMRRIKASVPGGNWLDWPETLRAKCHQKDSGSSYLSVYGRMDWSRPSPTITTLCYGFGNGRFGHPEQDRAISLREAAILQSFPKGYKFTAPGTTVKFNLVGRMIGNAVPVRLGEIIGKSLLQHVAKFQDVSN